MATYDIEQPSLHRSSPSPDLSMTESDLLPQPSFRRASPSPSISPTPAIGACPELLRSVSTTSSVSAFSDRSSSVPRDSFGSSGSRQSSASYASRPSSGSYTSRQSTGGLERRQRRGYVRPQGTYFAASAQSRESVMSLGSIAHLQYYFARTGLLDGKGGRLAKKKDPNGTLDLTSLDTNFLSPILTDKDSSYSSMGSSPELIATGSDGVIMESPIEEEGDDYFSGDDEDPQMLPPTVSTYNYKSKPIPPPPTLEELKSELTSSLTEASKVLHDAGTSLASTPPSPRRRSESDARPPDSPSSPNGQSQNQGWYELQGMHILDVTTLAIRAAKHYYTAHNQPMRLAAIKSERKIRAELLSVMDVLKRMATRNFAHGLRTEERLTMEAWINGVWDMLRQEEEMEAAEKAQRRSWSWLDDSLWAPSLDEPCIEREYAFLKSMDPDASTLPEHTPSFTTPDVSSSPGDDTPLSPSPFLSSLQSGLRLVRLHNAIVSKSKRPFGAIPTEKIHTDTAKPYRCAENLRFWVKAAELRWEVVLKVDVMGVVNGIDIEAWKSFEVAVWRWSRAVRQEISGELKG